MRQAVPQDVCFRHVVFPDSVGGFGRAMNLTQAVTAARSFPDLSQPPAEAGAPAGYGPHPLSPEAESFVRWLFDRAGLTFRHYKTETLARRLPACLRAVRAANVREARAAIQRQPQLVGAAVSMLVIGITSFFRDAAVFEALRQDGLPELLSRRCRQWARAGRSAPPLRVWSAGCSDGAELYSVGMLLDEWGMLEGGRAELLGTDCRPDAVARAVTGAFEPAAVKAVPPELLRRYFTEAGGQFHVSPALRAATTWRVGDVLAAAEPGPWDVVLCRNLSIYLRPEAAGALWPRLAAGLRPGGLLVPGKAERPLGARGLVPVAPCLYRREAEGAAE